MTKVCNELGDTKVKSGIKLTRSESQWGTANAFFHANLPTCGISNDLNAACKGLSGVIYDYFENHCGKVNTGDSANEWEEKYRNFSKIKLKSILKSLKRSNETENHREIRFVSKLLRSKITGDHSAGHESLSIDHDHEIEKNFWQYVKRQIKRASEMLPTFSKETCFTYFKTLFQKTRSVCTFEKPNWMPSYDEPKKVFNIQAPTYKEINNIIYKMKTASAHVLWIRFQL